MRVFFRAKERWLNLMNSAQNKISRGASNIFKIISWARKDSWRRKQKVKK